MLTKNDTKPTRLALMAALLLAAAALAGCYHDRPKEHDAPAGYIAEQLDSVSFESGRHYSENYNFIVKADSLPLLRQQPEELLNRMLTDTIMVFRHDRIAVADIRILPADPVDTVWVQVARDQETFGWVHESELLPSVVPDDPISQFISTFSDRHLLIFLIVISVISVVYLLRTLLRNNARMVHLNDIGSFYPTLLALTVAAAATLYATIQTSAPEMWRHFYYHPTLNPFTVPPLLSVFLVSVWAMLIVALAVADVLRHSLPAGQAVLYACGLAAVCALNYIVFSILTLYYIGYALLAAYIVWAVRRYFRHSRQTYVCGNCGARLQRKGRCPACGVVNE